jgi:starch-binding outer membrane protein, SusD/RagB family
MQIFKVTFIMKNSILFILISTIILLSAGCKKKLDISNPNGPTSADIWKTADYAQKGVNAIYSTYHRVGLSRFQFFVNVIRSDEGLSASPNSNLVNNFDIFHVTDYNYFETRSFYQDCYVGINRANQVLDNVPNITMDEAVKNQLLGEAKFMRGLFYYYLADYWGNVPIVLHTTSTSDQSIANSTQTEVWAQVEKDLTEAVQMLPVSYDANNVGRATRGAAYALLGKAYMQEREYQKALDAFAWLVTGDGKNVYDLVPNYRDNFVEPFENNKESVFEFQHALNPSDNHDDDVNSGADNLNYGTSIEPFFAPRGVQPFGFTDGQARRWVVWEFLKEPTTTGGRDPRVDASFLYDSTDVRGPDFSLVYGQTFTSLNYPDGPEDLPGQSRTVCFRKFLTDFTGNTSSFHSGNNYRFIRYADVLLLYAEALNQLGQTSQAYPYVDRVRVRAGLAPLSTAMPGLTQQEFLNQLKHERITELSGEGHRWEDLARWGDLGPQLASRDAGFANFKVGRDELLPLPQQDIDADPNLHQNPGY